MASVSDQIGIAVAGMGFMGRQHALNAVSLGDAGVGCRLAAVFSPRVRSVDDLRRGTLGNIDLGESAWPESIVPEIAGSFDDLLGNSDVDAIIVSTPTPLHVPMAIAALEAGKHVLVEKPVALTARQLEPLVACSRKLPTLRCMPAHVIRFWPGWAETADWIRERSFGAVRSASFSRCGSTPSWNPSFYSSTASCGGALVDLHVHDVDFILGAFGLPGSTQAVGDLHHVTGFYRFADGPSHVTAEAGWDQQTGAGFSMRFVINCERATLDFDLSRPVPLRVIEGDRIREIASSVGDGYAPLLRAFVDAIRADRSTPLDLDDAMRAARVIDAERLALGR